MAAAALQHAFFQPCLYVPPSFGMRMTGMHKTPSSVGIKGALESKNARRYSTGALSYSSGLLSNSAGVSSNIKLAGSSSLTKMGDAPHTGVQRKLEVDFQEAEKNEKSRKAYLKLPRYRPPARNRSA